jgi:hypothetical protein
MFRLLDHPGGPVNAINLYGAARRNFKPAAPNLTEAENAHILNPETTNIQEAGLKTLWLDGALSFNVTWFHMIFNNMVVGVLTPDGPRSSTPARNDSRAPRSRSAITSVPGGALGLRRLRPPRREIQVLHVHQRRGRGGERRGRLIELTPRDLWNLKSSWRRRPAWAASSRCGTRASARSTSTTSRSRRRSP